MSSLSNIRCTDIKDMSNFMPPMRENKPLLVYSCNTIIWFTESDHIIGYKGNIDWFHEVDELQAKPICEDFESIPERTKSGF